MGWVRETATMLALPVFNDRRDAGMQLAPRLLHLRGGRPIVFALPRGGVPVAFEVAQALKAPLDLLLVRKLRAPGEPELAVGAVVDCGDPQEVINEDIRRRRGISHAHIERERESGLAEIQRQRELYLSGRPFPDVRGRAVIVVDDGIATGASARAALRGLARSGADRVVLAVPVAQFDVAAGLESDCDEVISLFLPHALVAVGRFFKHFWQTSDTDVVMLLGLARART